MKKKFFIKRDHRYIVEDNFLHFTVLCMAEIQIACACVLSSLSSVQFCVTLWTVAHQSSLSMGFSRQEYWCGLQCLPPGDLPDPGIELTSLTSPALAGGFFITSTTWEAQNSE